MENDTMLHAYGIWEENKGSDFIWNMLDDFLEDQLKTKISTSEAYSSSSNPKTSVKDYEADTPSQIVCPMGEKEAKIKEEQWEMSRTLTSLVDLTGVEEAMREKNVIA
ncbi:hypothetical protein GmHk_15G043611 [Glycine max]|nr:hypothetical protein GmHk_15G043611 [Glycine max]